MKSKSLPSRPRIASRTGPPTKANLNPAAENLAANSVAIGALVVSVEIANSEAIESGSFTIHKVRAVPLAYDHGA